jgi:FAD/FMN-containing dehydrogenase
MQPPQTINGVLYHLPESNDDVKLLIIQAKNNDQKIAVRGAAHSKPLVDRNEEQAKYLYILLAEMNKIIAFDKQTGVVTVQAGCHLGVDPMDPTGISNLHNSLLYQLDPYEPTLGVRTQAPGWGLPDLGGITHQTVGGFIATGSSGGSTDASFESAILSVDIMYYDGIYKKDVVLKTFTRPENDENDEFYGVAFANLGLMGIVVSVTFQCVRSFNIVGKEVVTTIDNCSVDLFGDGNADRMNLEAFFMQKKSFSRILWWPQHTTKIAQLWEATWADASVDWQNFKAEPYTEFPVIFGSQTPGNIASDLIFSALDNWPAWFEKLFGNGPRTREAIEKFANKLNPFFLKYVLKIFEPTGKPPKPFHDVYWNSLPMDSAASDKYFPFAFTELWIPIQHTKKVMNTLKKYFETPGTTGNFSTEIYAAGKNLFWLSPAYKTDVFRVDSLWFGHDDDGTPRNFYTPLWNALAADADEYKFRPHWAKYLPSEKGDLGVSYLQNIYPMWQKWRDLRDKMDSERLFVTDYWARHLGL